MLGLATGSTPLPTYAELIRRHRAGTGPSYDAVRCFLLDEYVGLPAGHPETYRATIARELTDALGIDRDRVHGPDPTRRPADAGPRYEEAIIAAGGIDLQVLGIGCDGHLAFNEPGSSLASLTRIKTLTDRRPASDNARFFGSVDEVPHHVLTQGLGTILRARHLLLRRDRRGQGGRRRGGCRGSAVCVLPRVGPPAAPARQRAPGRRAASGLARRDHYREVYAAKPGWQGL